MFRGRTLLPVIGLLLLADVVHAHPQHGVNHATGLAAGLAHPLLGIDHLLAMLAVGLLSAQLAGRAVWVLPASFVLAMIAGGAAGMSGWEPGVVEVGIAVSVALLGAAVAAGRHFPLVATTAAIALFGLVHGAAHGAEMPALSTPALYAVGFVAATIALHVFGVVLGRLALRTSTGALGLRLSGAAIGVVGLLLIAQM